MTRENHKQIVERIKSSGESTRFLVVDEQCKVEDVFGPLDSNIVEADSIFNFKISINSYYWPLN